MENPFKYSSTNKRYHTFDFFLKERFGEKCAKIGLDGGFTCPNRDGTKGIGGCSFCGKGGAETAGDPGKPLKIQYEEGRARLEKKWGRVKTIPYFQSYTSTYAPTETLRRLYTEALSFEDTVGLCIATRPDALPNETLDLLSELNERTFLTVELGLQSVFDETSETVNRRHTYAEFLEGYNALKSRKIPVCVHLLNGLPGETHDMMIKSAQTVGKLRPDFIKFHALYIRKDAPIRSLYESGELPLLTLDGYIALLAEQLAVLPPETVVERVTGDPEREAFLAPTWTLDKKKAIAELDKFLEKNNIYQGICYNCTKF